jgi:hypothetical protein
MKFFGSFIKILKKIEIKKKELMGFDIRLFLV